MDTISSRVYAKIAYRFINIVVLISLSMYNLAIPKAIVSAADTNTEGNTYTVNQENTSKYTPPKFTHPTPRTAAQSNNIDSSVEKQSSSTESVNSIPVMFIENIGQFDTHERFDVNGSNGAIQILSNSIEITLSEPAPSPMIYHGFDQTESPVAVPTPSPESVEKKGKKVANVRLSFDGANSNASIVGFNRLDTKVSIYKGNNPENWRSDVPAWGGIRYLNIYDGIDLEITSDNGRWIWRFSKNITNIKDRDAFRDEKSESFSDSSSSNEEIRLKIEGSDQISIAGNSINISTELGNIQLPLPQKAFTDSINESDIGQNTKEAQIDGNEIILPFSLSGSSEIYENNISPTSKDMQPNIDLGENNKDHGVAHLASPVLLSKDNENPVNFIQQNQDYNETPFFSTYLGETLRNVAVDSDGNTILLGPVTIGGDIDLGVYKLNASGNDLISLDTYGGDETDFHWDCVVDIDTSDNIYILGTTRSGDFPISANAFDKVFQGESEAYIINMSSGYISYLGGNSSDIGHGIDVVSASAIYVTGMTASSNFSLVNPYDSTFAGGQEAFVSIVNTSGSGGLTYSTFLGGSEADQGHGIAVQNGFVYLTGQTHSDDFPASGSNGGSWDSFVLKLDPSSNTLVFSTYFGGSSDDCEMSGDFRECTIAVSKNGEAFVTGMTYSSDFPSLHAYDTTISGSDAYLARFSDSGDLIFSTYVGGTGGDGAFGIAVNDSGVAYLTGSTDSSDFPITSNGYDQSHSGIDVFLAIFGPQGYPPIYSTFLGGNNVDTGYDLTINATDMVYIAGQTTSNNFPHSTNAYQTSCSGSECGFVTAFYLPNMTAIAKDQINTKCGISPDSGPDPECEEGSGDNSTGKFGDPINTSTGQFFYKKQDISIPSPSKLLTFARSYSAFTTDMYTTTMGYGWTHSLDTRLILPDDPLGYDGYIRFKAHTTNIYDFKENNDGAYDPMPGVVGVLSYTSTIPYTYTLVMPSQITYTFDEDGVLQMIENSTGQKIIYSYNQNDRLTRVADENNERFLDLSYNGEGFVSNVTDHTSREITFTYNITGDLISYIDVLGQIWQYEYDSNHNLTKIIDPDENTVTETEYDSSGRAIKQWDGLGNQVVDITFNDNGTVSLENPLEDIQTHVYDSRGTLISNVIGTGITTTKQYDRNFKPIKITGPTGHETQIEWSEDGVNLTSIEDAAGNTTEITYDDLNNPTEVVDALDHVTTYDYDGKLLAHATDAFGEVITYTYTEEGYLESVTNPLNQTTTYAYDEFGQRIAVTNTLGIAATYEYDDLGRVINTIDAYGRITHSDYDAAGRVIKSIRNYDPLRTQNDENQYNIVTSYDYDARGNQIAVTDTYSHTTQYIYDDAGQLINTIDPIGNTITNTYNEAGQLITVTNALGYQTSYIYDEAGRQTAVTDALGNTSYTVYNPDSTIANSIDTLGHVITYTYDSLGRVIATTDQLNGVTTSEYDAFGNVITSTNALGDITTYEYDALGRLIKQTDSLGGEIEYFYDDVGNRIQTIDPRDHATTYTYDDANRLVKVADALGNETEYEYDDLGRQTAIIDDEGNRTEYTYDALDRVIAMTDPLSRTTTTQYDALGNVLSVTDGNNNITSYLYDDLYRQIQQTNALSGIISYTYNALGNQLTSTDENGHTTTFQYDALGRNISVTDPLTNTTSTYYDAVGQVISTTNALGKTTSYEYDALGRQISITDPNGSVTEQSYDAAGNLISVTDPNDAVTKYEYDESGHLTAVVENYKPGYSADNETNVRTEYTYDANGNRLSIKDANDHTTTFEYDELNRVIEESDPLENTWTYTYDSLGRKATVTDANGVTATYIYDDAGQLTGIDYPGTTSDVSFSYDSGGRRTQMIDLLGTTTWEYDDLNRIISITDPFTQTVQYDYDSVGNRTSLIYPDTKTVTYSYNSANQLTDLTDWDAQVTQYTYDPVGRLLSVLRPNGVDTSYSYNNGGQLTQLQHMYESTELATYQYNYDAAGNRTNTIENYANIKNAESISNDDFESGDISGWAVVAADEGDLSVTTEAKLEGDYGLQAVIDDINDIYVQDSLPDNEVNYNMRFYFDPNSVYLPIDSSMDIFRAYDVNSVLVYFVSMRLSLGDEYQIQISVLDDSQQYISSLWIPLTDETHAIEVDWRAASEAGANDGEITLWLDGNQKDQITGIDNDEKVIDYIQMGVLSPSTSTIAGTVFFDDFISNNFAYIGLNSNIQAPEIPDVVLSDAFESGDFSAWTDVITDSNDLTVTPMDVIEGGYSMVANINDQSDIYVMDSNPLGDTSYHARFYFDPNWIYIPTGEFIDLFQFQDMNSSLAFYVRMTSVEGQYKYKIQVSAIDDNAQTYTSSWTYITDDYHAIEIEWQTSSKRDSNDGYLKLWIDDKERANISNMDVYTKRIDTVKLGALSISNSAITGNILFDDFVSNRIGYIGLNPNIYQKFISDDAFESNDFSAWSDVITDSGDLTITGIAPIEGNYSLKAVVDDANDLWVEDDSPNQEFLYLARFYFDPYSISVPENEYVTIFQGIDENANPVLSIRLQELDEYFQVQAIAIDDDQAEWQSDWISLHDGINMIEFVWYKSYDSGSTDGLFDLWINDMNDVGMSGMDNDTKYLDKIELGVFSPSTTTISGTVFFDDFDSNRDWWLGQNPEVSLPSITEIFADNFETGEFARWDEAITGNGDLSVSTQASILGNYGLQATIDDNEEIYLTDLNPDGSNTYFTLFYFDPNSMSIPSGETVNIYQVKDDTGTTAVTLQLRQVYGECQIRASALDDNQQVSYTRWIAFSDEAHAIKLYWKTADEPGANNGNLNIYIDDVEKWSIFTLDNDTIHVDIAQLGVISPTTSGISGTIFLDDYGSDNNNLTLNPNFSIPELPEDIFEDDFESGDFSEWSTVITDTGDLIVTSTGAIEGSYGMQATIDDQSELYVYDESPWGNTRYQVRFFFDPNSITIPADEYLDIFHANDATTGLASRVRLRLVNDQYQVSAAVEDDSSQILETGWYDIDDEPVSVQLDYGSGSGWDSYDGRLKLWLNDELKGEIYGIDNFTKPVDYIQLGVLSPSTTTITGTVYFDDLDSNCSHYISYQPQTRILAFFDLRHWLNKAGEFISRLFDFFHPAQAISRSNKKEQASARTQNTQPENSKPSEPARLSSSAGKSVLANYKLPNPPQTTLDSPLKTLRQGTISRTITYTYDPLNRLTAADYSDNTYYHYTYDAVGNRLSQVTNSSSITYTYDIANRLTNTNGAAYTWDANGNLLSDGVNTYIYDLTNRLTAFSDGTNTYSYAYNGLGDRLQQTVNYTTTTYSVDMAGGLTQVLSDGTNTYLYGVNRISQQHDTTTEYFLDDALGSVRQLTDSTGEVVLARAYDPYGSLVENNAYIGITTAYGYTGEFSDASGMVYLRARYYSPAQGRFVSKDPSGLEENLYLYVNANPINFIDPSGFWRWWLGEPIYHRPIENYYEGLFGNNPNRQLEFPIPGTPFRHPDMFDSYIGAVFEIEPIYIASLGTIQVNDYVTDLNLAARNGLLDQDHLILGNLWNRRFNWNQTNFYTGNRTDWPGKYRKSPLSPIYPFVDLVADYHHDGVITYWIEPNALAPVLVGIPLVGLVPNKNLLRHRDWAPGLPVYQPAYAIDYGTICGGLILTYGAAIVVFTIVEDASLVGIVDDIVTVPTGLWLINIGSKLATFSPIQ